MRLKHLESSGATPQKIAMRPETTPDRAVTLAAEMVIQLRATVKFVKVQHN